MILNRLEIDVMQANELQEASSLAAKYRLPGLVVHPGLSTEALVARGKLQAAYKIYTPVDWPKGESFGSLKLRGLSTDSIDVDGFEILLTPKKNRIDTRNEIKVLNEFVRTHLGKHVDIRYVLNTHVHSAADIQEMLQGLPGQVTPAMIRNDIHLKVQVSKANPTIHLETIQTITNVIKAPIKISGNINDVRTMTACRSANKFAVSLPQAKNIIKEFSTQPETLKQLLD